MTDQLLTSENQQLPAFSLLKQHEQLAVVLKAEGKKMDDIVNQLNVDFNLTYKEISVREWFYSGGRLEQAYNEYLEWHADEQVREAKLHIRKLSTKASQVLEDLMDDKDTADNIKERAARTVLNKYIPDRQIIVDENKKDDLPGAIAAAAENVLNDAAPEGNEDAAEEPANPPEN